MSKMKNSIVNILVCFLATICCVLTLEFGIRKFCVPCFNYNGIWPGFSNEIERGFWVTDDELGYLPGKGWSGEEGVAGCQNGREYAGKKDDRGDILIIGDSVTQTRGLEKAFKTLLKDTHRIWNAGIGGYNTLQEAVYLEKHIKIKPTIIIVGFCVNDFVPSMVISPEKTMRFRLYEPLGVANPVLFKISALYRWIIIKKIEITKLDNYYSPEGVASNKNIVERGFLRIQKYARANDARLFCIVYPYLDPPYPGDWKDEAHKSVLSILEELNIDYVDMRDIYLDVGLEKLESRGKDTIHPNDFGQFLAAEAFLDKFRSELEVMEKEQLVTSGQL